MSMASCCCITARIFSRVSWLNSIIMLDVLNAHDVVYSVKFDVISVLSVFDVGIG